MKNSKLSPSLLMGSLILSISLGGPALATVTRTIKSTLDVEFDLTVGDKTTKETAKVDIVQRSVKDTLNSIVDGELVEKLEERKYVEFKFYNSSSCPECEPHIVEVESADNIRARVKEIADKHYTEIAEQKQLEKEKKEEHAKKLANLKKQEQLCKIKITDAETLEYVKITKSKTKSDYLQCQLDRFEEKSDNAEFSSERTEFLSFVKGFRNDLRQMLVSRDPVERDMALSLIENAESQLNNGHISHYLAGLGQVSEHYDKLLEAAETGDYQAITALNQYYASGQYQYEQTYRGWGPFSMQTWKSRPVGEVMAFQDLRQEMVNRMNIAMTNPEALLDMDFGSSLMGRDSLLADGNFRGQDLYRTNSPWTEYPFASSNHLNRNLIDRRNGSPQLGHMNTALLDSRYQNPTNLRGQNRVGPGTRPSFQAQQQTPLLQQRQGAYR